MKIIYIPLDERPCNTQVVERIASSCSQINFVSPPPELLGLKKRPANNEGIWAWLFHESKGADAIILSIDMLVYGGIVPSRIHYLQEEMGLVWIERLREFHKMYPGIPIYASNLIMRTPKYSSNDEEPDYYGTWGREIFLNSYLKDKSVREKLSEEESEQLSVIEKKLPKEIVEDYEKRRAFNLLINQGVLDLVMDGVITFLSIPQDDSAEYGYTTIDQNIIVRKRDELRLYESVHIYPGADEVGATLLARVFNDLTGDSPAIYPIWSSTLGPQVIPMYEDRPFAESMKAHILASGCTLVDDQDSADIILAYNTPGKVMQESWDQSRKDITYSTFRNMLMFTEQIKKFINLGKDVIVADSAYANGGDRDLILLLDKQQMLDKLISYKGWNTNCNTLGTTISQGVIGRSGDKVKVQENIIYHLMDDYFYQAEIRMKMVDDLLMKHKLSYFDLKNQAERVNTERTRLLQGRFNEEIKNSFRNIRIKNISTNAPWNRMFECGIELETQWEE
ncbi:DUF4127 family protein [Oceanobacillus manasiensis]|uniref:DUF4127 family protein n=1 Tax=Oceanobacillus manasiensis TaxID=586413 RepID=UPI0005A7CE5C|nr:DUF4127 family protein [Oceanobacillus manasiensis]